MPSGRTNNFPESGRGLGHVTPTIFGIRSNISFKYLNYRLQIWYTALYGRCRAGAHINFPESGSGRGLGHVTPTIFFSTVGSPSDSLASCTYWFADIKYSLSVYWFYCNFELKNRASRPLHRKVEAHCLLEKTGNENDAFFHEIWGGIWGGSKYIPQTMNLVRTYTIVQI